MLQTGCMPTAERMSGVDRAWLLMDHPSNPMTVIGLLVLESRLGRDELRGLIAGRFLRFERFRCMPVMDVSSGAWVASQHFAVDDHISCVALPAPAEQAELESLLGELAGTPFNRDRPLWSFHLVERYRGGSAVIVRIHHCYADGMALNQVLLSLCNDSPGPDACYEAIAPGLAADIAKLIPASIGDVLRGGANILQTGMDYLLHPNRVTDAARVTLGLAGDLAHIALMSDDPTTSLKQPLSGVRRAAWAAPICLEEARALGHAAGCTVNDVLISTLAGALGRYLEHQGDVVTGLTIRATIPVNLRAPDEQSKLGNRFGLVFVELPIGIRNPLERLWRVHELMADLKGSRQALATFGLLSALGSLPAAIEAPAIALFSSKASLVASNLPGPRERLLFGGVPVTQLLFWVPQAGSIGTGVSMLTYCGQVQVGVICDRQLIAEPEALIEAMTAEFERLVYLVLLGAAALLDVSAS
jgi:diacylglycerol O-acyltransferase / wax synthase